MNFPQAFVLTLLLMVIAPALTSADELPFVGSAELPTVAEASQFEATSTSEEVLIFLRSCDARAEHVQYFEFGRTSQDRPLAGLIIADPPVSSPAMDDRLTIMLLGNIHSGECDGKEALLMLARELAMTPQHPWLKQLVIIIVPNYNADGNDQMAVTNRPGQLGPLRGMGTRETAQGFDLNRDFVRLETPEGQSLVRLIDRWNPHVFIDCHTTNGSIHRYPLTYDIPHNPAVPESLRQFLRQQMMPDVGTRMQAAGFDTFYYGNFAREHTRWESFGFEPRYSTEYLGLRGRIGILAESYSYADYRTRVLASRQFVRQCIESTTQRAAEIASLLNTIEQQAKDPQPSTTDQSLPLNATVQPYPEKVIVKGRVPGTDEPQDYTVEFWGRYEPTLQVPLPYAYVIPNAGQNIMDNLANHGVQISRLTMPARLTVKARTVTVIRKNPTAFQKHHMMQLETEDHDEVREFPAGTCIVRTSQPLGRLAAWLLEPESCDGLVTWNFFDGVLQEGTQFPVYCLMLPTDITTEVITASP